ncbi:hypothetical protein NAV33_08975 [Pseudomonas stutzeri]|uniref:hypothetical protein n=1 Tax=Stutzerimonas stutzeri TaxID=316 RepID=UPI00210E744F|nr:hypothetical protein [Stutzerimonas stutzeri]MCQ4312019.1 hypothetical protein [Stutzerimonas stutzeri]
MKTYKPFIALTTILFSTTGTFAADNIPAYAMEMNTKRINGLLFRYTRFNSESPFPCLRLELIKPQGDWNIVEKLDICEMNGLSLTEGYTYSSFENLHFGNDALDFKFNYYSNSTPGEFTQECSVAVSEKKMNSIQCTSPKVVE